VAVPVQIQKSVDQLVGHHVPGLQVRCAGTHCTARDGRGLVVQLVRRGKGYVVRSAVA
jgi:hypothetical protein